MNEKKVTINEMIARMVAEARRLGYSAVSYTHLQGSAVLRRMKTHRQALTSSAYLWKVLLPFWWVQCEISVTYPQISDCPNLDKIPRWIFQPATLSNHH